MLVAVTALATTDSVFAYDKSQATAQTNLCGNGELPLNVGCQNTGSKPDSKAGSKDGQDRIRANLDPSEFAAMTGTDGPTYTREAPGMSAFALSDGVVYHTYSTYARGLDALWGMYQWLDRAPNGRNEPGSWLRRHDEYI